MSRGMQVIKMQLGFARSCGGGKWDKAKKRRWPYRSLSLFLAIALILSSPLPALAGNYQMATADTILTHDALDEQARGSQQNEVSGTYSADTFDAASDAALARLSSKVSIEKACLGGGHSAAIDSDHNLWMWGNNSYGQLGDGTRGGYRDFPYLVMKNVIDVSLGSDYSAAIDSDHNLWTWGNNSLGRLGNGSMSYSGSCATPKQVMENVKSVCLGYDHSAAIKMDGTLWMWGRDGYGKASAEFHAGVAYELKPKHIDVEGMENVVSVSLGQGHSAAVTSDGRLWTWGHNDHGQLGRETKSNNNFDCNPKPIEGLSGVRSVSLGYDHSAAILWSGALYTWGSNSQGQLGNNSFTDCETPQQIIPSGVISASMGLNSSACVMAGGELLTWGGGEPLKAGEPLKRQKSDICNGPTPLATRGIEGVQSVSLGRSLVSVSITSSKYLYYVAAEKKTDPSTHTVPIGVASSAIAYRQIKARPSEECFYRSIIISQKC